MKGPRRWLILGVLVYLAILVAVSASLYLLGRASRERLDEALGERLVSIAVTASYLVDGDSVVAWTFEPNESLEFIWLASRLEQIRLQNDLAEISLCAPDGTVLISAAGRAQRGDPNAFWSLDAGAVQIAQEGFPSASKLYRVGRLYQKSAHAPITTSEGMIAAVLSVEGNADFFDALSALRGGSWITGIVVVIFLSLMGWLLFRLHAGMERYRASVWQQENLAAMGRMTAGIAHEIRNPLGIIRGAAQTVAGQLEKAELETEMTVFITDEVDRLDRILRGYLAFGGDKQVESEPVDLLKMARRTVRLLQDEFAATGIEVVWKQADSEPPPSLAVRGDERRLQQVLLNLLLNARDAMPGGGRIIVSLTADRSQASLTVADEGQGLGGLRERDLFTPFWTSKEKGSGLGLSVSRKIIDSHGGELKLDDRTDRHGAVAMVRLPLIGREPSDREGD